MRNNAKPQSKFSGLLAAAKDRGAEDPATETPAEHAADLAPATVAQASPGPPRASKGKVGRPPGKRSSAEFAQVTAYISKTTHQRVKIALLTEGGGREFSELVEELLAEWLEQCS